MAHLTFSRVKPIIVGKGESLDGIGWSGSKRPKYKVLPDGGTEPGAELVPSIIQPKFDGWRLLVHIRDGNVRFLNKQGQAFGRSLPFLDTPSRTVLNIYRKSASTKIRILLNHTDNNTTH